MYQFLWIFFAYAFLGWCTEVCYAALVTGRFVNRGFLNGPVCPIYGFGVVIVLLFLEPLKHNLLLLFLGSVLLTSALEWLTGLCAPVLELLGIPPETTPLMLVRPVSGSGALAVGTDLITTYGPDSYIGRVAAVMLGSTETTLYTIAVYFGSAGIIRTRHTVPAALAADLTGFFASAFAVRLFFGA